jgi:ketosteroid isomerase-like protein
MSQENVEIVKRFQELSMATMERRGDYRGVLELLDPDVVVRVCASLPHGGEWVGHDGFVQMSNAVAGSRRTTTIPEFTHLDAGGDYVVVLISFMSQALQTRQAVPIRMVEVFTVRNGKITSLDPYYEDTVPFFKASGGVMTR